LKRKDQLLEIHPETSFTDSSGEIALTGVTSEVP
jgi:hypothetical protein